MPQDYYTYYSKEKIKIAPKAFAGGGEGDLYKITSPSNFRNYVAKIYHPHKQTQQREQKTKYLIEHPPMGLSESGSIVWIIDALYDDRHKFVGFIMPFVKGEKLEVLSLGKLPRKLDKKWHRFDLRAPKAMEYRLRICFNLAAAIYQMHATEHYVLVDMKPDNIIVQSNGLLAIVDTDSVEVIEDGIAIFPAPVATPEYTPPEFYTNEYREHSTVGETWDRFGLGVILYKLLFGIHPFTGTAKPPLDHLVSLHEKIEHGLFVHSNSKKIQMAVVPPPHKKFDFLNPELQALFIRCFDEGHHDPNARPTANEWCTALLYAIGDPKLEEHFGTILGLVPQGGGGRFKLPSAVFKQPKSEKLAQEQITTVIDSSFPNVPVLPGALQQLVHVPVTAPKGLEVATSDYVISWALFFLGIGLLNGMNSGLLNWMQGDFWLSSFWFINVIIIAVVAVPQFIGSYLVALLKEKGNSKKKLSLVWAELKDTYPKISQEINLVKQDILKKIYQENSTEVTNFKLELEKANEPIAAYLKAEDAKVEDLAKAFQEEVEDLDRALFVKAKENALLREVDAEHLMQLDRKLEVFQKVKMGRLETAAKLDYKALNTYKDIEKELNEETKDIKTVLTQLHQALEKEARNIFEIESFMQEAYSSQETQAEKKYLEQVFKEEGIECIYNIGVIFPGKNKIRFMYLNEESGHEKLISIDNIKTTWFVDAFEKYKDLIDEAKKENIKTEEEFVKARFNQERRPYEREINKIKGKYELRFDTLLALRIKEKHAALQREVKVARALIQSLKEAKKEKTKPILDKYGVLYDQIIAACQEQVDLLKEPLKELDETQRIAIEKLLETADTSRMKISLNEQVASIQSDILKLKDYKPE